MPSQTGALKLLRNLLVPGVTPVPPILSTSSLPSWGTLGLAFTQTNWGNLLGCVETKKIVHIFIFVRRCDLHFTLLLHLFRQVKANELLMNRSVKYSPPSQPPILMLLISQAFLCVAFQLQGAKCGVYQRAEWVESPTARALGARGGRRGGEPPGFGGPRNFQPRAQSTFPLSRSEASWNLCAARGLPGKDSPWGLLRLPSSALQRNLA